MRITTNINKDWTFTLNSESCTVDLPHTWNGIDGQSDRDYYRGIGVYEKVIPYCDGRVYIEINGANTRASVFVNGDYIGEHINGYGMFRFEIGAYMRKGKNTLKIKVDNSHDDTLYPQTADFTFYGGIYRDVNIIQTASTHFALLDKSRTGVYITPHVNGNVFIKSNIEGKTDGIQKKFTILDADGNETACACVAADVPAVKMEIDSPVLWNGRENPYLYTLKSELIKDGEVIDNVTDRFGFRQLAFSAENGFSLNGNHLKMKGVSRHQDRENLGNALTVKEHAEDIGYILDVGANAVRLAHYQQSEDFYSLCDEKGLLVWAEIPVISKYSLKKQEQARLMLEELIKQNYNHPSIFCWGIENEISIASPTPILTRGITELNAIAHKLDSTRPTACAQVAFSSNKSKLNFITDILGYNQYFGWYVQTTDEIGRWLDTFHAECPSVKLCLSEYGAEAITTLHSEEPKQGDYSEEYQAVFHEKYLEEINKRDWLWGSFVWNMFDFGSASRNEGGVKGRNNKGLITIDRKIKKDSFWLYKAYWSDEKFVHITGERFVERLAGTKEIKVYSNCDTVTLSVNGGKQALEGDKIFRFTAEIKEGENEITAVSGNLKHSIKIIGVTEENESYRLGDGQQSFVRNWFEAGDELDPDRLSLNDTAGEIVNNSEVQQLMDTHLGKSFTLPSPVSKLPLKQVTSLISKTKRGRELTTFANQFLQTIKKD